MGLPLSSYYKLKAGAVLPHELSTKTCLRPLRVRLFDPALGYERELDVPCGKCLNCQAEARDEWVSRMCLHSFSYKFCYFVTLTYGSYNLYEFPVHPFKDDWSMTFPVRDRNNTHHKLAWTPSILRQEHLTKFLKRLRINTGADISYCACGEYGSTAEGTGFGRPHFHLIIWSQSNLSTADFSQAWSLKCVQVGDCVYLDNGRFADSHKHFTFKIGNVVVDDLVASGALDWDAKSTDDVSATKCFSYVAKYIKKRDDIPDAALLRFRRTFVQLPLDDSYYNDLDSLIEPFNDKIDNYRIFTKNGIKYEKCDFKLFTRLCAPFFTCSRSKAIGKQYLLSRVKDFASGNYALPPFRGKRLTFPKYFARLTSSYLYPFRVRSFGEKSVSFIKSNLPYLLDFYQQFAQLNDAPIIVQYCREHEIDPLRVISMPVRYDNFRYGNILDVVSISPENRNIYYSYDADLDSFIGKSYNLSDKSYHVTDVVDRADFCDMVVDSIKREIDRYHLSDQSRQLRLELYSLIREDPLTPEAVSDFENVVRDRQHLYKSRKSITSDKQ